MSRVIKFRAWDGEIMLGADVLAFEEYGLLQDQLANEPTLMQYTGLLDKEGVEIYEGDLLNIFFTSHEKEHNHDCVYEAKINDLYGITFDFKKLLWESFGHNQFPSSTTLTSRYNNLDNDYQNQKYDTLAVKDTWEKNHLLGNEWKGNDYSNYFEIIGNIHQHPELLKDT